MRAHRLPVVLPRRLKISDRLLLLLADYLDYNRRIHSWQAVLASADDPRFHRQRDWMLQYLSDKRRRGQLYRAFKNLKRRQYLAAQVLGSARGYLLTPKAEQKVADLKLQHRSSRPKLPTGQWLMVFFDIREERRIIRDRFRRTLARLGFVQLQKSVWVTDHRLEQELQRLITTLQLSAEAKMLFVQQVPGMSVEPVFAVD